MSDSEKFVPKIKLTIHGKESFFGPGIAELMSLVQEKGSVKNACREMGLSYTKGWTILNRAEKELGYPVIRRNHGGMDGGTSSLTEQGEKLLSDYYELEKDVDAYTRKAFRKKFPEGL
ncbi:MAG: LysR family transcriptional regulator [Lachnospiraceae bacterium]|jgi:molybdate transport repressor ModE-like protein|nr:LysR family transcriptional regulator [Lachnospiraceae bacterium]MCI1727126.1 LysR family transcriptional regulator [Lachnospiraceae bacterium]